MFTPPFTSLPLSPRTTGGMNGLAPILALHLVPLSGEPLVSHLRMADKYAMNPPTTYVIKDLLTVLQDRKDIVEYRQTNLTVEGEPCFQLWRRCGVNSSRRDSRRQHALIYHSREDSYLFCRSVSKWRTIYSHHRPHGRGGIRPVSRNLRLAHF